MGYFVGKMISENEKVIENIPVLKEVLETNRTEMEICYHKRSGTVWFKLGRKVLERIDKNAVLLILRFKEMEFVEGGGVFYCAKSLKEIHDEIVYSDLYLAGSEEFYFVSLCQYLFCLSPSVIERLVKDGSYVKVLKRSDAKRGRKVGVDYSWASSTGGTGLVYEPKEDVLDRIEWNKTVAVKKGLYFIYEDAMKEEASLTGQKFDKKECLKSWEAKRGQKE